MDDEFGDYGPPRKPEGRKSDRTCNVCGKQLSPYSPNWFQCSERCRRAKWEQTSRGSRIHPDDEGW